MKKYIFKYKTSAFLYLLWGTVTSLHGIAMTFGIQYIVDIVTNKQNYKIPNMFIAILIYLIGMLVSFLLYGMARNRFCVNVMQAIRKDLFKSLFQMKIIDFSKQNTGYYTSLFQNDLKVVENTLTASFLIILQVEEIIFSLTYAFLQNIMIGIMLVIVGFVGMLIPSFAQKILQKNQEKLMDEAAKHNGFINDNLHGYEVIKNYQVEDNVLKKYDEKNRRYGKKLYKSMFFQTYTNNATQICLISLQLLLIAISGIMVLNQELNISFITVVVGLSSSVIGSMCSAVEAIIDKKAGKGICQKIWNIIESCRKTEEDTEIVFKDSLTLKNISYSYPNMEMPVLVNLNVTFQKGKKYLIIGESGSGKSTFIKLLLQYFDNYQGEICLDGVDVREISSGSVMKQFAVIPQNVFMFEDTLKNNITLYNSFSEERIMEAIKKAGLEELVEKLENGLNYVIKEGGINLSGGEQQRISIARAFLHNRKIWIMDEATSSLDKEMAKQIEQTVLDIPDITVIMIAHHYNAKTIERCDEVYKIEDMKLHRISSY